VTNGHNPLQPGVVARIWSACTATWKRAFVAVVCFFILVHSGLVAGLFEWVLAQFLIPLAILAYLGSIVVSHFRKPKSPH
jgi:hypothetical protein